MSLLHMQVPTAQQTAGTLSHPGPGMESRLRALSGSRFVLAVLIDVQCPMCF